MLGIDALTAGYGEVRVLDRVSLEVAAGSITALVGSNGAGKTTLMRAVAGLVPAEAGRIALEGADLASAPPCARVERGLALVPEGRLIFPGFSVEENLRIGATAPHARAGRAQRMREMYALFPILEQRRRQAGGTLSGGEQQMLAIARGLMSRPRLLLLDEPSLGLAPAVAQSLFETIVAIRGAGVTVFIVEQDIRSTLEIADSAYVLENGRIAMSGTAAALLRDPQVKQAYLGL
ncbi:MAG: ABC transporter ATP-binding protein [Defluviicoccus sp.]|nr:ABC transporter ATP-binding protein [Defluviicoccus sp.]MDE0382888.1 ABC transporter ATP-binding protein [Defluviicoccus sp.]